MCSCLPQSSNGRSGLHVPDLCSGLTSRRKTTASQASCTARSPTRTSRASPSSSRSSSGARSASGRSSGMPRSWRRSKRGTATAVRRPDPHSGRTLSGQGARNTPRSPTVVGRAQPGHLRRAVSWGRGDKARRLSREYQTLAARATMEARRRPPVTCSASPSSVSAPAVIRSQRSPAKPNRLTASIPILRRCRKQRPCDLAHL